LNVAVSTKFCRLSLESHLLDLDVKGNVGLDTGVTEKYSLQLSLSVN